MSNGFLKQQYKVYTKKVSTKVMAISYELAQFMWNYINDNNCKKILDLGSGFSSVVFRYYKQDNEKIQVVSVDTSQEWLDKTKQYLNKLNLNTDNLYTFDEFKQMKKYKYDFILYDLGNMITRAENLDLVLSYKKKNGVIIVDDVHKEVYRNKVHNFCASHNLQYTPLKETIDVYGRYSVMVK